MLKHPCIAPFVFIFTALLCGCAAFDDERFDRDKGWRSGWIEIVGEAGALGPVGRDDCRRGASSATLANHRYAVVGYVVGRSPRGRIAALPIDSTLKVDDSVYFNVADCDAPVISR